MLISLLNNIVNKTQIKIITIPYNIFRYKFNSYYCLVQFNKQQKIYLLQTTIFTYLIHLYLYLVLNKIFNKYIFTIFFQVNINNFITLTIL